jgi:hypothetical protein
MRHGPAAAAILKVLAAWAVLAWLVPLPATAADAIFPIASRLGLVPPFTLKPSTTFPGFEDDRNQVFVRLVALPAAAFPTMEKTLTSDALRKEGMTIEKRETLTIGGSNAILAIVRQDTKAGRVRKWLLMAPIEDMTALVSLETPLPAPAAYPDDVIRTTLLSLTTRPNIPADEQLKLVPFRIGDIAGFRLVRVVPGVAVQFTEGPKDALEATEQPQLIIAASPGGPADARDRDQFARDSMSGLPPFKEFRITNAEPMRIGGQPGYEVRAQAKDVQNGAEIEIVQWLRFGTGAYLRILGFAPKDKWSDMFTRFRAVRDGLEPR